MFSSASSKTVYGTAWCMSGQAEAIALTSAANRAFTGELGCYVRTFAYGELERVEPSRPTVYVDFSGDPALRARVHRHFGASLVHDCFAGSAQNNEFLEQTELPGPQPQFYFAPNQIRKRNADWGAAELTRRLNEAQSRFVGHLSGRRLLEIEEGDGLAAARAVIAAFAAGRTDPRKGHVIRLG